MGSPEKMTNSLRIHVPQGKQQAHSSNDQKPAKEEVSLLRDDPARNGDLENHPKCSKLFLYLKKKCSKLFLYLKKRSISISVLFTCMLNVIDVGSDSFLSKHLFTHEAQS